MTVSARSLVETAFYIIYLLILVRIVLSWVPVRRYHPAIALINNITEPLLRPFRRLLPPWRTAGLDVSPIILMVSLWIIESIVLAAIPG